MMEEWICLKCFHIFLAGASYAKCCGEIEIFNPQKHAQLIIGMSNSWKSVDEKISSDWSKHPLYEKVWRENVDNGCDGASSIFIDFVEELINKLKE